MKTKLVGFNVYYAPDGSEVIFYGFAESIEEAKELAKKGKGLPRYLWETADKAGHCNGLRSPERGGEAEDVYEWFGEDRYDCAVAVYEDDLSKDEDD